MLSANGKTDVNIQHKFRASEDHKVKNFFPLCFGFCFTVLQQILGHFGRGQLT